MDAKLIQRDRIQVYKETTDDWCPSYQLKDSDKFLVRVAFLQLSTKEWRVCVWGDDDCGMELDFKETKESDAILLFQRIIRLPFVNFRELKQMGLHSA